MKKEVFIGLIGLIHVLISINTILKYNQNILLNKPGGTNTDPLKL